MLSSLIYITFSVDLLLLLNDLLLPRLFYLFFFAPKNVAQVLHFQDIRRYVCMDPPGMETS